MAKRHILVVEDDPSIARLIVANLKARNFEVTVAASGKDALTMVESEVFDLVILDIGIPEPDGIEVCRRIREWSKVPIIMLSAQGDEKIKVSSFEMGADDYLTKPFGLGEFVARIQTALRHYGTLPAEPAKPVSTFGGIEINFARRTVSVNGRNVKLTATEYLLLQELWTNKDKVLTHDMLLKRVWGGNYSLEREYLRVFVGRLRQKLEPDPKNPQYIITVHGVGYYLSVPDTVRQEVMTGARQ